MAKHCRFLNLTPLYNRLGHIRMWDRP